MQPSFAPNPAPLAPWSSPSTCRACARMRASPPPRSSSSSHIPESPDASNRGGGRADRRPSRDTNPTEWASAVLANYDRHKINRSDDAVLYAKPCLRASVDEAYATRLTALYAKYLRDGNRVLDLCASWQSFLPEYRDVFLPYVEACGMNADEMAHNTRLSSSFVQNLNATPATGLPGGGLLPLASEYFEVVLNNCGIPYLERPEDVYADVHRILAPNGVAIISFSDRMVWDKAMQGWRNANPVDRVDIVTAILLARGGFEIVERILKPTPRVKVTTHRQLKELPKNCNIDPFYAVVARKL